MRLEDLDFDLPAELVAQRPTAVRDACRLLHVRRAGGRSDRSFGDLPSLLRSGDLLVRNVSRVLRARLQLRQEPGRRCEVLLVEPGPDASWWALARPAKRLRPGDTWALDDGIGVDVLEGGDGGRRRLRVRGAAALEVMQRLGHVPLPHYIRRQPDRDDADRYQTVYARVDGSVAAPTAGLHFTPELLQAIRARGVDIADVVLHVGPGTFEPVRAEDPSRHVMHWERFEVERAVAAAVRQRRDQGGRVVAVGTTACRVLESLALHEEDPRAAAVEIDSAGDILRGRTRLFVHLPFRFRAVDVLLTNFHLPRSTLLMLVDAFAGGDIRRAAYAHAIAHGYRFFSYGDATLFE
jgi:S-adenosylmethionine:tRNA ribosyltransferase-isomerase